MSLRAVAVMINVYGIFKMGLKREKEKVAIKLKCSNNNSMDKWIGPNKKLSKWLKLPGFRKAKFISGVGTKRKRITKANSIKEKWFAKKMAISLKMHVRIMKTPNGPLWNFQKAYKTLNPIDRFELSLKPVRILPKTNSKLKEK